MKFKTERLTGNFNVECNEMTGGKRDCRCVNRKLSIAVFSECLKVSNLVEQMKETLNCIFSCVSSNFAHVTLLWVIC